MYVKHRLREILTECGMWTAEASAIKKDAVKSIQLELLEGTVAILLGNADGSILAMRKK